MGLVLDLKKRYTYADYLTWADDKVRDLIVEIQSFSTAKYDLNEKFKLYEAFGVREYWVVYPREKGIEIFLLQSDGKYDNGKRYEHGKIPVTIFNEYEIDLEDIF